MSTGLTARNRSVPARKTHRMTVLDPTRPLASTATHPGDGPKGFSRCFQANSRWYLSSSSHPSVSARSPTIAGSSSGLARRMVTSAACSTGTSPGLGKRAPNSRRQSPTNTRTSYGWPPTYISAQVDRATRNLPGSRLGRLRQRHRAEAAGAASRHPRGYRTRAVVNDHELPKPSWFLGGKGLELAGRVRSTIQDRQYDADGDDQVGATSSPPRYPVSQCPRQPHRS